jgi:hypothetical protein
MPLPFLIWNLILLFRLFLICLDPDTVTDPYQILPYFEILVLFLNKIFSFDGIKS